MSGFHHHAPADDHGHHHDHENGHNHGHGHEHGHGHQLDQGRSGPGFWPMARSRRAFLGDFGRGTLALAVFTPILAACTGDDDSGSEGQSAADQGSDAGSNTDQGSDAGVSSTTAQTNEDTAAEPDAEATGGELQWARTNLGFVSAYVLARGNTAAIVDTGTSGSADAIGQTLTDLGLNYSDVAHVILTHHHGDHAGSIDAVLGNAPSATVYAGERDLGLIGITAGGEPVDDSRIVGLTGGEDIFGFEALATPGHTDGHMAAIDHTAGLLVAGDAIFTEGDQVVEGPERFFSDVPQSRESIALLASLSYNTLLVGHGDPIETGADAAVAALAATL